MYQISSKGWRTTFNSSNVKKTWVCKVSPSNLQTVPVYTALCPSPFLPFCQLPHAIGILWPPRPLTPIGIYLRDSRQGYCWSRNTTLNFPIAFMSTSAPSCARSLSFTNSASRILPAAPPAASLQTQEPHLPSTLQSLATQELSKVLAFIPIPLCPNALHSSS